MHNYTDEDFYHSCEIVKQGLEKLAQDAMLIDCMSATIVNISEGIFELEKNVERAKEMYAKRME